MRRAASERKMADHCYFIRKSEIGNNALGILKILRHCKAKNIKKLAFEKGEYALDAVFCEQRSLNISNHGLNGPKRIGVLLEGLKDFEIDFNGSVVTSENELIYLAVLGCENVTIKNVTFDNPKTKTLEMRVEEVTPEYIRAKILTDKSQFFVNGGKILGRYGREYLYLMQGSEFEFNAQTGEIEYGTGDGCLGDHSKITYEDTGGNEYLIRGFTRTPPVGNILVSNTYCRCACGILIDRSKNVKLENVTIHACFGMGLLGQFSENVSLNSFKVKRKDGRFYTCNADATHFVCCKGLIQIENSLFEGQLDDALNVHGMYVRVLEKLNDHTLLLKQMHCQATGLPVFEAEEIVNAVDASSLLPYARKTVAGVEIINDEISEVHFKEPVNDIRVGDNLENITKSPSVAFVNNEVKNNRARGMLIASKGKTVIKHNYFHTAGAAILFEADGQWWFEAGGTQNVEIFENYFDRCKHGKWGEYVIQFNKLAKESENEYFHDKITVTNNKFTLFCANLVRFDNIRQAEFQNNVIENGTAIIEVSHCGKCDIQNENIKIEKRKDIK